MSDILELNRSSGKQKLKSWLVTLLGFGLLGYAAWLAIFEVNQLNSTAQFLAGSFFLVLGWFSPYLAGLGAWFLKTQRECFDLEIDSHGLKFLEATPNDFIPWAWLCGWQETENLLILKVPGDSFTIPKRCLEGTIKDELLAIFRSSIRA